MVENTKTIIFSRKDIATTGKMFERNLKIPIDCPADKNLFKVSKK